jgi:hypothetical protein
MSPAFSFIFCRTNYYDRTCSLISTLSFTAKFNFIVCVLHEVYFFNFRPPVESETRLMFKQRPPVVSPFNSNLGMSNYAVSRIHIKFGIGVTCTSCGARVNFVKISAMKKNRTYLTNVKENCLHFVSIFLLIFIKFATAAVHTIPLRLCKFIVNKCSERLDVIYLRGQVKLFRYFLHFSTNLHTIRYRK